MRAKGNESDDQLGIGLQDLDGLRKGEDVRDHQALLLSESAKLGSQRSRGRLHGKKCRLRKVCHTRVASFGLNQNSYG